MVLNQMATQQTGNVFTSSLCIVSAANDYPDSIYNDDIYNSTSVSIYDADSCCFLDRKLGHLNGD